MPPISRVAVDRGWLLATFPDRKSCVQSRLLGFPQTFNPLRTPAWEGGWRITRRIGGSSRVARCRRAKEPRCGD